jgi:hypothetical protein
MASIATFSELVSYIVSTGINEGVMPVYYKELNVNSPTFGWCL